MRCDPELCADILASIADAVITTDEDGRVKYLNAMAASLTGWSLAEACGKPLIDVFNIVNEETRNQVESPTVRALLEGVVVELANHTLLIAKDGTEHPIDDSAAPIRNANNEVVGVVLVFRSITERKQAERGMAHLAAIVSSSDDAIISKDLSGIITSWNQGAQRMFGYAAEEIIGKPILLLIPPECQYEEPEILERIRRGEATEHYETVRQRKDGTFLDISLSVSPVRDAGGRIIGASKIARDITEQKRVLADLELSESRYRRLFEAAKDGILILDAETLKVIDANPFMTELLGYSTDELLGKELWEIGFWADKRASQAAYGELKEQGYIRYDHLPLETKGGLRVEVEFVCNTYQVGRKNVAQCNIRDISERSRLEKKMQEQATALVDLHRRKDEFLAMLSHELRNPLAPIADAVKLLLRPDNASVQEKARTIIERQVAQLTRLIDDLMEVSRISTGKIRIHLEPIVVNAIVERAMESTQSRMDHHKHEITFSPSPEPVWVQGDAARLEQVIVNLLANAAKYTADGGRISVVVRQESEECVVRVRDTGVGIAAELLPHIFELFSQADRSLDRAQGGLGIGLALVQRLVELQHGRVEAFSSLGQGSEFVVRIPVTTAPASPDSAPRDAAAQAPAHKLRVLVVDDNEDAAEGLSLRIEASGHQVKTALDGPRALATAGEFRPNIVLMDIGLPGMTGYDVAKQMRADPLYQNVKLVAITGYGQAAARQRSLEAGFDHHLVKPADFRKLNEILAAVPATAP